MKIPTKTREYSIRLKWGGLLINSIMLCSCHAQIFMLQLCDVMDTALVWNYGLNICSCTAGEVHGLLMLFQAY